MPKRACPFSDLSPRVVLRLQVEQPVLWRELAFGKLSSVRRQQSRRSPLPAPALVPSSAPAPVPPQGLPLCLALRPFEVILRPDGRFWCVEGDDGKTNGAVEKLLCLNAPRPGSATAARARVPPSESTRRESLRLLLDFSNAASAHAHAEGGAKGGATASGKQLMMQQKPPPPPPLQERAPTPPPLPPTLQPVRAETTPVHASNRHGRRRASFVPGSPSSPAPVRCTAPSPLPPPEEAGADEAATAAEEAPLLKLVAAPPVGTALSTRHSMRMRKLSAGFAPQPQPAAIIITQSSPKRRRL